MADKDRKLQKAREIKYMNNQISLQKQYTVANPAKRLKEYLGIQKCTKDILFGEFDSFKNWDTRVPIIGLNEEQIVTRNRMLGYSST